MRTLLLLLTMLFTTLSCSENNKWKYDLDEEILELKTKEYILTHNESRNYLRRDVVEISEFEVNLNYVQPKILLKEYIEQRISSQEDYVTELKKDYKRTSISVYKEMMNDNIKSVDSLYKVLLSVNPNDSIYECSYYFKNDYDQKGIDEEFPVHWTNLVDKESNILEHMTLIGYND